ncbi:MAG: OmpA family protein [Candidatus Edwardsbacteria bacterium]|nr:OmpA family protein [Candidatus Edwardsbacteria bacterium]
MRFIKTLTLAAIMSALLIATGQAYNPPAFDGGCGTFKVSSARTLGKGMLGVGFLESDLSSRSLLKGDLLFQGDTMTGGKGDQHYTAWSRLSITYAPLDYFEFSIAPRMYAVYDKHSNVEGVISDRIRYDGINNDLAKFWLRDLLIKVKGSYPSKVYGRAKFSYAVGLEPFVSIGFPGTTQYIYTDNTTLAEQPDSFLATHGFGNLIPHSTDFGAKFLTTLSLGPASLHGNIGYLKAGSAKPAFMVDYSQLVPARDTLLLDSTARRSYVDSVLMVDPDSWTHPAKETTVVRENQILWGLGLEIDAGPYVTFVLEAGGEKLSGKKSFFYNSPARITPGIRFKTPGGFTIDGGCEFKMTSNSSAPEWNALFGFSVASQTLAKAKPVPQGVISGKVLIANTDSVLMATITMPGYLVDSAGQAKPILQKIDGSFSITVPPGTYRMRVSAGDSFLWQERPAIVADGQTLMMDFPIKRKEYPKGTITGKVVDKKTGNPMGATLYFYGPDRKAMDNPATSDLLTGIYSTQLPPNIYNIQAHAEGYNIETAPAPVNDKQTFIQNFEMRMIPKKGEKVVLSGIKFRSGKADIMASSMPILDEAAKLLKENPTIKVEIGGHTDSRGSAARNQKLSEARAYSVRNYLINKHGIAGERLTAVGYGEDMPMETNKTVRGRAANRRIEFVVMSQQ